MSIWFIAKPEAYLPWTGHIRLLQSFTSKLFPSQLLPGCFGFGFVHVRDLCLHPPPHVFEHLDHPSQADHTPSTPMKYKLRKLDLFHYPYEWKRQFKFLSDLRIWLTMNGAHLWVAVLCIHTFSITILTRIFGLWICTCTISLPPSSTTCFWALIPSTPSRPHSIYSYKI